MKSEMLANFDYSHVSPKKQNPTKYYLEVYFDFDPIFDLT